MNKFVHLRMYTEYSIECGIIKIKDIIYETKKNKKKFLSITDTNNLFGCIDFYKNCLENKIKPIIGCEIDIKNNKDINKPFKLLILIKNYIGYLNLSKLISKAYIYNENKYMFDPIWFNSGLSNGLIAISGGYFSDIAQSLIKNKNKLSQKKTLYWSKCFKDNFYLEIQKFNKNINKNYNKKLINLSNILKIPLVATHPILFINENDFLASKIKDCIHNNIYINNWKKKTFLSKNLFFFSEEKMINMFKKIPNAIKNTIEIAKKCNLYIDLEKIKIPFYKTKGLNNNKLLIKLAKIGLKKKLKIRNYYLNSKYKLYKKKLMQECLTIISSGLTDYFLIVYDFINWSKDHNITVGPGRGSCTGSLVSYCLNITELDPIKYSLIFERFLNSQRISAPDVDIDFCPLKRDTVINYIKKKYGVANICNIITFGKMATKAAIRDIGRILGFNYTFINKISKLIPFEFNNIIYGIKNIIKKNLDLNIRYKNELEVKNLLDLVSKLEGITKNISIHAGGIIISSNKIFNIFPAYSQNNMILSQYDKIIIEKIGVLKFDFLGLTTLTIISNCIKNINKNYKLYKFIYTINLKDKLCFFNLKKAKTNIVFQLESEGMKNMLKEAQPDNFENIVALISLYRPGPIDLLHNFCSRKLKKKRWDYIDKRLKNILKETYGIIIYQEQVMLIAQKISGFSLEEADILRKSMSKKNSQEMLEQKNKFILGAIKSNMSKNKALKLYKIIEKFSGYGFNKSHAAAYSLLSYYTLWLKTYYLPEFIASNMTFCLNDIDKLYLMIKESIKNNIFILPININKSNFNFISFKDNIKKIRYGFSGIKRIGKKAAFEIINLRKKSFFKSFKDFYNRINKNILNYRIIEALIMSGAFDNLNLNKFKLLNELNLIKNLKKKENDKSIILPLKNLNKKTNLSFWKFKTEVFEEKAILGFFFFNNLYNVYKKKFLKIIKKNKSNNIKKNILFGVLVDIKKRFLFKKIFYLFYIDNLNQILKIKISKDIYLKYENYINILNLIIIFKTGDLNKKNFLIKKILSIKNFIKIYDKN